MLEHEREELIGTTIWELLEDLPTDFADTIWKSNPIFQVSW